MTHSSYFIPGRLTCVTLLAFVTLSGRLTAAEPPADVPAFAVTVANIGPEGGTCLAQEVAQAMGGDGWCKTRATVDGGGWNVRPKTLRPDETWLSVAIVGFNEKAHAFVIACPPHDEAPFLLAHVPYVKTVRYGKAFWVAPAWAVGDAIRERWTAVNTAQRQPPRPVKWNVNEWRQGDDVSIEDAGPAFDKLGDMEPLMKASTSDQGAAFTALKVMTFAALNEAGWQPSLTSGDGGIAIEGRFDLHIADIRLLPASSGLRAMVRKEIPETRLYDVLLRMCWAADPATDIFGFAPCAEGPVTLLAAGGVNVWLTVANKLLVWNTVSEQSAPATSPVGTYGPVFQELPEALRSSFCRWWPDIALISPTSGRETLLSREGPSRNPVFAVADAQTVVVARGTNLICYHAAAMAWSQPVSAPITSGPAVVGTVAVIGTEDGFISAHALANGTRLWQVQSDAQPRGWISAAGDRAVWYDRTDDQLVAMNAKDGAVLWKYAIGDILLKPVLPVPGGLLVVSKSNRLAVLDPATGKPRAELVWPTWLLDVTAVPDAGVLGCLDQRGGLSVVDSTSLKLRGAWRFPAPLAGALVYAPVLARPLPASSGGEPPSGPALIVSDREGFCYAIAIRDMLAREQRTGKVQP